MPQTAATRSPFQPPEEQETEAIIYFQLSINKNRVWLGLFVLIVLASCSVSTRPAQPDKPESVSTSQPALSPTVPTATVPSEPSSTDSPDPTATLPPSPIAAGESPDLTGNPDLDFAQVLHVQATQTGAGLWRFDTTVRHNDAGWEHYADAWQVIDPAGKLLAERILTHPHDNEQPFTRSQGNIAIPPETTRVIVQAKCNAHGFGGQRVLVDLTVTAGENFEVVR